VRQTVLQASLLLGSQAARLVGPGLAMLVLAGRWTPTDYGDFAAAFALASVLGLLPATGFSAWLLDRSARSPGEARRMVGWALAALLLLLGPLLVVAYAIAKGLQITAVDLALALTLTAVLTGAADVLIAALRAQQLELPVALAAVPANLTLLAGVVVWHGSGALAIAILWGLVRGGQCLALGLAAWRYLPLTAREAGAKPMRLRDSLPFVGSQMPGVLYGQIDTLLVRVVLGETAAGLYNAALRLLMLASFAAQSLSQWFQPRLATAAVCSPEWLALRLRLRLCLGGVGMLGLIGFTMFAPQLLALLYGPAYADAAGALTVAGFVLAARCFVAAQWIELTALKLETHRARDSWILLGLFSVLALPFGWAAGAAGVMMAHQLALGPIAALSGRSLARARQR
jgi:O-antigen/teichoic acid export membrane protein